MFHVVLHEPEIPQNTGNIGRLCVGTTCKLHLIKPLGFQLEDRYMKRAGLDYWQHLDWTVHEDFDRFLAQETPGRLFLFTKKASRSYWDITYREGDYLVFGKETVGLPEYLLGQFPDQCCQIPMTGPTRSINLANSVAVAVYEGIRQLHVQASLS